MHRLPTRVIIHDSGVTQVLETSEKLAAREEEGLEEHVNKMFLGNRVS
jgi:hypothetical protein